MLVAEKILRTLAAGGVDTCFANPGTTEMHLVGSFDAIDGIRPVLGLFEGVCTGAADGYGRMAGKPAATLLHLGPGLANGLANLHNARRAGTPLVNIVGEHATGHIAYDAPLTSDIQSLARSASDWVRTVADADSAAEDAAAALSRARAFGGGVATLVLPADVAWSDTDASIPSVRVPAPEMPDDRRLDRAIAALRSGEPAMLLIGGDALVGDGLDLAGRVAAGSGARLFSPTFFRRAERGVDRPVVERLPYFGRDVTEIVRGVKHLILVDAKSPVAFFGYPGQPSDLVPDGCEVHDVTPTGCDPVGVLEALDRACGARAETAARAGGDLPMDAMLNGERLGRVLAATMPEGVIVADESNTTGLSLYPATANAAPHDWLCLTGGAIGQGMPVATGAAVACPDRTVINLESDGSAMYTLQSLWTQSREGLDVKTLILSNRAYAILGIELANLGFEMGDHARSLISLAEPRINFVGLAESMGVPARRTERVDESVEVFQGALARPGPYLIEVLLS